MEVPSQSPGCEGSEMGMMTSCDDVRRGPGSGSRRRQPSAGSRAQRSQAGLCGRRGNDVDCVCGRGQVARRAQGSGGGAASGMGNAQNAGIWRYYTDDAAGLKL